MHASKQLVVPDEVLVNRLLKLGDRAAWAELHARHNGLVTTSARRILMNPDEVQEVAQAVWVEFPSKVSKWNPGRGPLPPWLRTVTVNKALRHIQSAKVSRKYLTALGDEPSPPRRSAEDKVVYLGRRWTKDFEETLESLTETEQAVLRLWMLGVPFKEIATIAGVSEASAKSKVHRALGEFRERLEHLLRGDVS